MIGKLRGAQLAVRQRCDHVGTVIEMPEATLVKTRTPVTFGCHRINPRLVALVLCATLLFGTSNDARAQAGFDRPGGDYSSRVIRNGDPAACAKQCERDSRCRAWSFSYPITASRDATCWLKNAVTPAKKDTCCISGVRGGAFAEPIGSMEFAIDRYGGDYKAMDIPADPKGEACAKACQADNKCRAFTYARPGYGNSSARCYLKDRITKPRRKPCCISGVVR